MIAFLHKDPLQLTAARVEQTDDGKAKLKGFRELLQQRMCKYWDTPAELGSVVSRSLVRLTRSNPATGWIRADEITDALAATELLKLRKTIEELESRLQEARSAAPAGSEKLAQGEDLYSVDFTFDTTSADNQDWSWNYKCDVSWDSLFYDIGPHLINEAPDDEIQAALNQAIRERSRQKRNRDKQLKGHKRARNFAVTDHDFQTIKIQLRALGLITKSQKPRSVKDTDTYWTLTPYGDQHLTTLRAIPKEEDDDEDASKTANIDEAEG